VLFVPFVVKTFFSKVEKREEHEESKRLIRR